MRRRRTMGRKSAKAQHGSTTKPKRNNAPTAARPASSTLADLQEQVGTLTRELAEARKQLADALEQQTATADVLKVISRSTFDLKSVLATLVESAVRLCEADGGHIARPNEAGRFQSVANYGMSPEVMAELKRIPFKAGRDSVMGRALLERRAVQIVDAQTDPDYKLATALKVGGYRSMLGVPLMREGTPIGVMAANRHGVRPFSDRHIELLTTFADQAAIAIENTRLLNELRQRTDDLSESLDQQTATSEVLRVISSSPGELEPVFQTILVDALQLCEAKFGFIFRYDDQTCKLMAHHGAVPEYVEMVRLALHPGPETVFGRIAKTKQAVHVADLAASRGYAERDPLVVFAVETGRVRTILGVPMLKDNELIGAIIIYRQEVRPFTDKQVALLTNFAAQAVIAIENARLLNELRESLQQQTATADVLKVISRSTFDLSLIHI